MTSIVKQLITGRDGIPDGPTYGGRIGYRSHLHVPRSNDPRQHAVLMAAILDAIVERQAVVIHGSFADVDLYKQVLHAAEAAGRSGDLFEIWSENDRPGYAGRPYHSCLQFDDTESYNRLKDVFLFPSGGHSSWVPGVLLHCMENFLNLMRDRNTLRISAETIPNMLEIPFLRRIVDGEFGPVPGHLKFVSDYLDHVTGDDPLWKDGTKFGAGDHENLLSQIKDAIARLMSLRCTQSGTSMRDVFERQLICFVWSDAAGSVEEFVSADIFHSVERLYVASIVGSTDWCKRSLIAIGESRRFLQNDQQTCGPSFSHICRSIYVQAVMPTYGDALPDMAIPVDASHAPYGPDVIHHVAYGVYRASGTRMNPRFFGQPRPFSFRQKPDAPFNRLVRLKDFAVS